MRPFRFAFALIAASALAFTAPAPAGAQQDKNREGRACIHTYAVRDFAVIDSKHLILEGPTRSRVYLVTLLGSCFGVRGANAIALKGTGGRVCGRAGDEIMFDRHHGRCFIDEIYKVADREEARSLAEERRAKAEEEREAKREEKRRRAAEED